MFFTSVTQDASQLRRQQSGLFAHTAATQSEMPSQPIESFGPVVHALWAHDPIAGPSHAEQLELMHVLPPVHAFPHEPQFALSFVVVLHWPLQHVWFVQTVPHEPQLALSVMVSTQTLLHAVWLPLHPTVHFPATQLHVELPPEHTLPHEPQFFASVWVSMQAFPQTCPLVHVHCPALHVAPVGQTLPQLPQFCGFVWVLPQPTAPSGMFTSGLLASNVVPPSGSSPGSAPRAHPKTNAVENNTGTKHRARAAMAASFGGECVREGYRGILRCTTRITALRAAS